MTTAGGLLRGAAWLYGAQVGTVVAQLGYAAITSRMVDAAGFGAYATALAFNGIIVLLSNGGLSETVGRMDEVSAARIRPLVGYGALLGVAAAAASYLLAPYWAQLWGAPQAASPIRLLAVAAAFAPLTGVTVGLMRRLGRFRRLSQYTLGSNLLGMAVGAAVVVWRPSPVALVVFPVVAQITLVLMCALSVRAFLGTPRFTRGSADIGFSRRVIGVGVLTYLTNTVPRFATSRWIGEAALGSWNRAEVLTVIPVQQAQTAVLQALYPEFRHDVAQADRARRVWTDLLVLLAWVAVPGAALLAIAAPRLVPVLFGPGWDQAAMLASWLAVASGAGVLSTTLSSAIQAVGRFAWLVQPTIAVLALQIVVAALIFVLGDVRLAMAGLILSHVVRHVMQVAFCGRAGYLDRRRLTAQYLLVGVWTAALTALVLWGLLLWDAGSRQLAGLVGAAVIGVALGSGLWAVRRQTEFVRILKRYGLAWRRRDRVRGTG